LDIQLSVQSVPNTTKVVRSNPVHGEVYSIQHYIIKFVSDLRQISGFLYRSDPVCKSNSILVIPVRFCFVTVGMSLKYKKLFVSNISKKNKIQQKGVSTEKLDTTLYNKVCQRLATDQWFSPPIKLTATTI
jgi:hypothetical protein